jgi:hypothetical protein
MAISSVSSNPSQLAARLQSDTKALASDTQAKASQSQLASDRARIQHDQQALAAQRQATSVAPSNPFSSTPAMESNSARGAVKTYL